VHFIVRYPSSRGESRWLASLVPSRSLILFDAVDTRSTATDRCSRADQRRRIECTGVTKAKAHPRIADYAGQAALIIGTALGHEACYAARATYQGVDDGLSCRNVGESALRVVEALAILAPV
jgi:hypothetical protein